MDNVIMLAVIIILALRLWKCAIRRDELEGVVLDLKAINEKILDLDEDEEKNDV